VTAVRINEAVDQRDADHLQATLQTRFLRVTARFNVRGGIYTTVVASDDKTPGLPRRPVLP